MADEKEVIVTREGGGGGAGMIIALVVLIVVALGAFLLYKNGVFSGGGQDIKANIKIETPAPK